MFFCFFYEVCGCVYFDVFVFLCGFVFVISILFSACIFGVFCRNVLTALAEGFVLHFTSASASVFLFLVNMKSISRVGVM